MTNPKTKADLEKLKADLANKPAPPAMVVDTSGIGMIDSSEEASAPDPKKVKLPKGIAQEQYDIAKRIIVSGMGADQEPDAIKSAMFEAGIGFSKLSRLFTVITIAEGMALDPKEITKIVDAEVKGIKWTFEEDWSVLSGYVSDIVKKAKGTTSAKVTSAIKNHWIDNEKELPRKPAPVRGRIGSISKTVIDVFANNKKVTEKELAKAILPHVKAQSNADYYAKLYHKMMYAAANGLTSLQVMSELSSK